MQSTATTPGKLRSAVLVDVGSTTLWLDRVEGETLTSLIGRHPGARFKAEGAPYACLP
jgi:hypothetical protein